jgi:hypothetical protein
MWEVGAQNNEVDLLLAVQCEELLLLLLRQ